MGKRSDFERKERDFYPTPREAVEPLLRHLKPRSTFDEPCAGDGALANHLEYFGFDIGGCSDIVPQGSGVNQKNVFDVTYCEGDMFITNPPWDRKILHPLITHLSSMAPTWLLFDASWMHTKQSSDLIKYCEKIVSVGRIKWFPGTKHTGKDDCCWYLFGQDFDEETKFFGR